MKLEGAHPDAGARVMRERTAQTATRILVLRERAASALQVSPAIGPWLALLFVGAALIGGWFLLGPLFGSGAYYRSVLNRTTYGYNRPILLLFVPYAVALWAWRRGSRVRLPVLLGGAVALHLLVLFAPLPQSQDFYQYLFYGRMQAARGLNPYVVQPQLMWRDGWYGMIRWPNQTSVYGPVWTLISYGVARASAGNLNLAIVMMKTVVFAMDAAVMWCVLAAARDRSDPQEAAGWGLLVYAWNPLILITVPLGGLADTAIAAAFLGALVARRRGRTGLATLLLSLAALVKVYAVIGLILHLVLLARERGTRRSLRHLGAAVAVAAVTFAPYWAGWQTFRGILNVARLSNKSLTGTVQRLLVPLLRNFGSHAALDDAAAVVRWLVAPAMVGVVAWAIVQARNEHRVWYGSLVVLCAYVLLTPWFLYWYIVAPLALVAVLPRNRMTYPLLTFTGTALVTARFAPWLLGQVAQTALRYGPPLAVWRHQPPLPNEPSRRLSTRPRRSVPFPPSPASQSGRFIRLV